MINKRGQELIQEVPGLVIAIIGIVLVGGLIYLIYLEVSTNQENQNAKNILSVVQAHVDALKEGESTKFNVRGFDKTKSGFIASYTISPAEVPNWYLVGWGNSNPNKPDKCALSSCLCICKAKFDILSSDTISAIFGGKVDVSKACQTQGYCNLVSADSLGIATVNMKESKPYSYPLYLDKTLQELNVSLNKDKSGKTSLVILKDITPQEVVKSADSTPAFNGDISPILIGGGA